MTSTLLNQTIDRLLSLPAETEIVEFKEAKKNFDFDDLGKYFSALANEANLKNKLHAWLVFGVEDKKHRIVSSQYRPQRKDLDHLKEEIANQTTNRITFIEIHEVVRTEGRVVLFEIPPAPKGIPIAWKGHYYGRDGEALSPLNLEEIERIRVQATLTDWSAGTVASATIDDLDESALKVARQNYKRKFPDKATEVEVWDTITFLNKAKLAIKGKITRAAIILLGKEESEHFINPSQAKIRWVLKDSKGNEKDYLIVSCPMLLSADKIYAKIRKIRYRYIKDGSLFPEEVDQYEPFTIREAINNCIAHQDYAKGGMVNVIEKEDQLIFTNLGSFIPGSVERVVIEDAPAESYRNPFLVSAMFNLNMVDTVGGGIRKIFNSQRQRFFPMPDYDLGGERVQATITAKVLDMEYARLLARVPELTLEEIIMLDKVQKKKLLSTDEERHLKQAKLIEGRKPNFYIAQKVAQATGQKAAYSKNRAFDQEYYRDLILKAIGEHKSMMRKDIDELLWKKLPEWMVDKQRKVKINNLLSDLRKTQKIENTGSFKNPIWKLVNY